MDEHETRQSLLVSYELDEILKGTNFDRRKKEELIDFFFDQLAFVINQESFDRGYQDGVDSVEPEEIDEDSIYDNGYDEGFEEGKKSILKSDLDRAKEAYYGPNANEI